MLGFKKKEVKVKDEVTESGYPLNDENKGGVPDFEHFHTCSTQRRSEVAEFLSGMRDKYKLIHWEFETIGGGQYFIVAEVDEK